MESLTQLALTYVASAFVVEFVGVVLSRKEKPLSAPWSPSIIP